MVLKHSLIRPTYVEVNLVRLVENYRAIQNKVAPAAVMPVLKANAYGHGLIPVARKLTQYGVPMLAVAILEEGLALRQAGIRIPILVLGGLLNEQIEAYLEAGLIMTVSSGDNLAHIEQVARSANVVAPVHIKIDTGMGRLGLPHQEAVKIIRQSLYLEHVTLSGVFSHFASSDSSDLSYARLQLARFNAVLEFFERENIKRPMIHMANSGGVLQLPDSYFDIVRPGIMLYGLYPSHEVAHSVQVRPVLAWKTRPVLSKVLPPNHPVSYGSTWQSELNCRILTIPMGYGDGYFRALSNKGSALVRGKRYPIAGRVCMDQIMLNLGDDEAGLEDEVVLIGTQGESEITAQELADLVGTISYEILTNINTRVPRIYLDE